jgi:uncharacterized membrane protein YhaH (DUF805 family)
MDDRDFLVLDPPAARAALATITDDGEQARLRRLYARTRGFLVDGTGWVAATAGQDSSKSRYGWLSGRINRARYWLFLAIVAAIYGALSAFPHSGHISVSELVLIAICVPRLHDVGLTGWVAAIPLAIEIIAVLTSVLLLPSELAPAAMGLVVIGLAILLIILGAIPGQKAANRFGPPPRPWLGFGRKASQPDQAAAHFE